VLTIESRLQALGRKRPVKECPHWPPDLWAIAGGLLKRSGAYLRVFDRVVGAESYLDGIDTFGRAWRASIDALHKRVTLSALFAARPKEVQRLWRRLIHQSAKPVNDIRKSMSLSEDLIRMALIADDACAGIGID
jgi:hypothetical protein